MKTLLDKLPISGHLTIQKVFPGGNRVTVFSEENLITLASRQAVLALLYTFPVATPDPVRYLKVGTGGTVDPEGLFPKQENELWTNLNTPITSIGAVGLLTTTFSYDPTIPQVTFLVDLDTATANGNLISEAGLFTNSQAMFNVKCFPGIPKTTEFALHFAWIIKFA